MESTFTEIEKAMRDSFSSHASGVGGIQIGIEFSSKGRLNRQFGLVLLNVYLLVTYLIALGQNFGDVFMILSKNVKIHVF